MSHQRRAFPQQFRPARGNFWGGAAKTSHTHYSSFTTTNFRVALTYHSFHTTEDSYQWITSAAATRFESSFTATVATIIKSSASFFPRPRLGAAPLHLRYADTLPCQFERVQQSTQWNIILCRQKSAHATIREIFYLGDMCTKSEFSQVFWLPPLPLP
jgi:hypothetical protein